MPDSTSNALCRSSSGTKALKAFLLEDLMFVSSTSISFSWIPAFLITSWISLAVLLGSTFPMKIAALLGAAI